jgi:hypothetical protein
MKKLDLAAFSFDTGIIIANRAVQQYGDYKHIAFIDKNKPHEIHWYVKKPTQAMRDYVNQFVKPLKDQKPLSAKK